MGVETPNSHGENVLRAALWTIDIMGEDAQAGIAPTPSEWYLNISVAETIVRMMEATNKPGSQRQGFCYETARNPRCLECFAV